MAASALASPPRARAIRSSTVSVATFSGRRVVAEVAAEVPRERGEVRDVRFPAAGGAAPAPRAVDVQRHVTELPGDVVLASHQLAAEHDPDAEAVRHREVDEVARRLRAAGGPELRQRAGLARSSRCAPGTPSAAAIGSRRLMSRHPRFGASSTLPVSASTMPGTTTPTPWQRPRSLFSTSTALTRLTSPATNRFGSRSVGKLVTLASWWPTRSVTSTKVRVGRMSIATTHRLRESM